MFTCLNKNKDIEEIGYIISLYISVCFWWSCLILYSTVMTCKYA